MTNKQLAYFLGLTATFLCVVFYLFKVDGRQNPNWIKTIESDGLGYHMYLLAIAHNDFEYQFADQLDSVYPDGVKSKLSYTRNQRNFTKYYCGVALMSAPFFGCAFVFSAIFNFPVDGLSLPFQYAAFLAALSYFLAGLWLINKLLVGFKVQAFSSFLVLFGVVFATNTIIYIFKEPGLSHVYVFFLLSLLLVLFQWVVTKRNWGLLYPIGLICGLMAVVRPTSILSVFFVFLLFPNSSEAKLFFNQLLAHSKTVLISLCIALIPIAIQLVFYYLQTGDFIIYSYGDEGFDFIHPETFNFLFSFKKGWLLYTPFMVLILLGVRYWYKFSKYRLLVFSATLGIIVWVLSSWWSWYFGGSFGMRAMIDFYPVCSIAIGVGLKNIKKNYFTFLTALFVLCCAALNLTQAYQYNANILDAEHMSKDKYFQVFLNTSDNVKHITANQFDPFRILNPIDSTVQATGSYSTTGWNCDMTNKLLFKDKQFLSPIEIIDKVSPYSCGVDIIFDSVLSRQHKIVVKVEAEVLAGTKVPKGLVVVTSSGDDGGWYGRRLASQVRKKNQWSSICFLFLVGDVSNTVKSINTYIYNPEEEKIFVSGIKHTVYYCVDKSEHEQAKYNNTSL